MNKKYEYPYTPANERPKIDYSFLSEDEHRIFKARYSDALTIANTMATLQVDTYTYRSRMAKAVRKILAHPGTPEEHKLIIEALFTAPKRK